MTRSLKSFSWKGVNQAGLTVRGIHSATSKEDALKTLTQQRIRVYAIRRHVNWRNGRDQQQPTAKEVTAFMRQLATLLHAGIALLQCFEVIMRGQPNTRAHAVASALKTSIEAGSSFHQALRRHRAFDDLLCNLVQAGEMTGALDTLLDRIATHREKSEALQQSLRSAMVYPVVVLVVALVVSGLLLTFVVPAFASVFETFHAELPLLTRGLMALSLHWHTHGVTTLLAVGLCGWVCQRWVFKRKRWLMGWHGICLHLPVAGDLIRQACLARWTRTLATLLSAGIPLTEGLVAVAGVTGHLHYALATQQIQKHLLQGQSLSSALALAPHLFQPMLIQMCAIGEASGTLDDMLNRCADQYDAAVSRSVARLSVLVEPLLMVVLGLLIGGMVLALYLPIFQMGQMI